MTDMVELAARALSLAAGEDPDAWAEFDEVEEQRGPYWEKVKVKRGVRRFWQKHTREAKAVLMAVGINIDPAMCDVQLPVNYEEIT